ncbi:MAG: hypothetical protein KJO35_01590, partial [Gammaproteobacteria bacterium]|nr:hypothetical protein [Gammaproteobacteria bacterium]
VYADFLVIISTGFACAFFLLSQVDTIFVFVAASVFTAGSACALYTSTIKRQAQPAPNKPSKKRLVGVVARILIDSPVSIIFLCSLRIFPQALAMYLLVAGTVYIVLSLIIGYKNFQE